MIRLNCGTLTSRPGKCVLGKHVDNMDAIGHRRREGVKEVHEDKVRKNQRYAGATK